MEKKTTKNEILSLPYSDRQLIVVADDAVVRETRHVEKQNKENTEFDWMKLGGIVATRVVWGVYAPAVFLAQEAIKAWSNAREMGLPVLQISKSEATSINFPVGHPREGVLYVGHPAMPFTYYTLAEFHRVTFEHKFCEAVRLLMSLGAMKISVEHVSGWNKDFTGQLSVPLSAVAVTGEVNVGGNSKESSQLLYEATLPGNTEPKLPENLIWLPYEPTWQTIASGRIDFGLQNFSLSVSYEDDYGVNAGLKVTAKKSGLELGGKFEDHQSTVWRISGKFK